MTEIFVHRVAPVQRIVSNFVHKMVTPVARGSAPYKVVKYATDVTQQVGLLVNLRGHDRDQFRQIDAAMGQSTREASSASQAATATSSNVQMMTSAAEELAASVSEMAQSMATSRVATDIAFAEAKSANEYTNKPSSAAEAMGGIISLIQNIAGQINLLALNATFESARAGEAGPYRRRSELCLRPPTRRRTPHVCLRGGDLRIQEQRRGFIR